MGSCNNLPSWSRKVFLKNFSSSKLASSDKDLLSKGLHFAIPPKQIDHSKFMTEFELLYWSNLDLSMTSKERDHFKIKLKDIALSYFTKTFEKISFKYRKIPAMKWLLQSSLIFQKYLIVSKMNNFYINQSILCPSI